MVTKRTGVALITAVVLTCAAGAGAALARPTQTASGVSHSSGIRPPKPQVKPMQANMANAATLASTTAALRKAGVSDARVKAFSQHVTQFNTAVGTKTLAGQPIPLGSQKWDEDALANAWTAKHRDFLGYNCRITAYGLYGDLLTVDTAKPARTDLLFLDHEALDKDASGLVDKNGRARFDRLWSSIPTTATKDVPTHIKTLQKDWAARGIRFSPRTDIRLVSVVMHDTIDKPQLFVGHTGVMVVQPGGSLLFVEKLAFQKPYQEPFSFCVLTCGDEYPDGGGDGGEAVWAAAVAA